MSVEQSPTGESIPFPQFFTEICALSDLTNLAFESCSDVDINLWHPIVSFKLKSDFYPVGSRVKDMDTYQKLVERDLTNLARNVPRNASENLTADEKLSLESLNKDISIVIKNADKGGQQ